ncbi:hypothetical protein JHK87_015829 [Glycine soja]|nr:hypothetical protein JHK87_015829 [Glycine soja]
MVFIICVVVMSHKENLISELHTRKGTWKIAVRITDLWQARKQNNIVGVIADLIDVKTVNPPHRMTVRLRDNSNCDILITVWEDYAIQLHDAIDKNLLLQEPLVVMLTLGKIKDATSVSGVG